MLMPLQVSDNPQTFNQALLLISSLARLAPEVVIRNVMPIFTFMGSSVLHRDDEYSSKVVQKVGANEMFLAERTNSITDHRQHFARNGCYSKIQMHEL